MKQKSISEKYRYLGKNTIVFGISSFGTKFLSFLLVPLYTSILTTKEYGIADIISTTSTLLVFVLTINIAEAVLRFSIEKKESAADVLSFGIRVLLIGSLCCSLALGVVYLLRIVNWPAYYYLFILLNFVSSAFYQIMSNYLRGIDKIKQVAIAGIITSAGIILSNILFLVVFKVGVIGYLASFVIGPALASVYCVANAGEPARIYFSNCCDTELRVSMRKYCIPLIFNNIALWINAFLDRYFIVAFRGAAENGLYSVASKIPMILATCYTVFSQAWNLSAIREFDPQDKDGFFSRTYSAYSAFITIACSGLIVINILLARIMYAKGFFQAWQFSSVLLLSVMYNSFTSFIGSIFTATKRTRTIATTTIISAVVNSVLNIILIPPYGALGAAIATVSAYLVMWALRLCYSRKHIHFRIHILRDCTAYAILILQVVIEHMTGRFSLWQLPCFALVIILYCSELRDICQKIISVLPNRKSRA